MEFLVRIQTNLPPDLTVERRAELLDSETARGVELRAQGMLCRIRRIPDRFAKLLVYDVADATELHEVLRSSPLWPWMDVEVRPLARHALDAVPFARIPD
jgi:muconolactone D-isomerase